MAVSIADIQKLRKMTGAGLADCKKALTEADGDIDKAVELVRERGLAIAAKRSDRETTNGCLLVKKVDGFAAMVLGAVWCPDSHHKYLARKVKQLKKEFDIL